MFPHLAVAVAMAIHILAAIRRAGVRHCRGDDMIWNGDRRHFRADRGQGRFAHESGKVSVPDQSVAVPNQGALKAAGLSVRQS